MLKSLVTRFLGAMIVGFFVAVCTVYAAETRPWTEAVPVNIDGSHIEIAAVSSDWASDYDVINRRQGPVYYNDCLTWVDRGDVAVMHVQFVFATVTTEGEIKHELLPLDVHHKAVPGEKRGDISNCRDHAYANGADGLWLIAWPNVVDFADGTHWQAPPIEQMTPYILDALPKAPAQ